MSSIRLAFGGALAAVVLTAGGLGFGGVRTASAAPDPEKACVGAAVSEAAHITQDEFGVGLGEYFHELGIPTGKAIQAYRGAACS